MYKTLAAVISENNGLQLKTILYESFAFSSSFAWVTPGEKYYHPHTYISDSSYFTARLTDGNNSYIILFADDFDENMSPCRDLNKEEIKAIEAHCQRKENIDSLFRKARCLPPVSNKNVIITDTINNEVK